MRYKIDVVRLRENTMELNGWALGKTPDSVIEYEVLDGSRQKVDMHFVRTRRDDVSEAYYGTAVDKDFGFDIRFPWVHGESYDLVIRGDGKKAVIHYNDELIRKHSRSSYKRLHRAIGLFKPQTLRSGMDYLRENGIRDFLRKTKLKFEGIDSDYEYSEWYELVRTTEEELARQRNEIFDPAPLFSIVIPAYRTPEAYLRALLDSLRQQTYTNFEVCIADGSPKGEDVSRILGEYAGKDPRIHYTVLGENRGISGNTNAALAMAKGDYIVLADHDDTLTPDALYELARNFRDHPSCDMVYSDEDKLDMDGGQLFDPHFKPDFNPDLLCSVNYICHLLCVRKDLAGRVGGFREEFDGAQDYDFIFRCTEQAAEIRHIPKVLYHWRCHRNSTASNPESKLYAFEAGARVIGAHYDRVGIPYEKVEKGVDYGIYHTVFRIQGNPLVSIVIPNKDHAADLDTCLRAVEERATYRNVEFVIVENNSTEQETFDYYEKIRKEFPNVRVVTWKGKFNYSAINNFGVRVTKGDYLLFLNNDTELIAENFIEEMLGYCQRSDVGAVGARLLYQDGSIQHAGVVVGFGGIAGAAFVGQSKYQVSYFHRAMSAQDYSAVTAACLMTKREVFDRAGGFSEDLAVAFNDIDYCMKVRAQGKLVVYNPYAVLHHYESKSRGLEDTPEKVARFNSEIRTFAEKWPDILKNGDPYYNPNLTLRKADFSLRDLRKEKIGEPYRLEV